MTTHGKRPDCERCLSRNAPDLYYREEPGRTRTAPPVFVGWCCIDCAEEIDEDRADAYEREQAALEDAHDPAHWRDRLEVL